MLFGEIPLVLGLQVDAPLDGKLELLAALCEDFDGFGVGQAAEIGRNDFLERLDRGLVVMLVEEGHVLGTLLERVLENPLEEPLGEVHVVGQLVERHLGLDHPEFGEVPRGVAVLGAKSRAKSVNLAERAGENFAFELAADG